MIQPNANRADRLRALMQQAGLFDLFSEARVAEPAYDDFTKLFVVGNPFSILSFELYTHDSKPETLRVHHSPAMQSELRNRLGAVDGAALSPTVGIHFSGDLLHSAKQIRKVLGDYRA